MVTEAYERHVARVISRVGARREKKSRTVLHFLILATVTTVIVFFLYVLGLEDGGSFHWGNLIGL